MKKKYNHAISVSFTIDSDNEIPKSEEMLLALKKMVETIEKSKSQEDYFEIFDSEEN